MTNFFTPASQKEKTVEKLAWRIVELSLVAGKYTASGDGLEHPSGKSALKRKVAAFDFVSPCGPQVSIAN